MPSLKMLNTEEKKLADKVGSLATSETKRLTVEIDKELFKAIRTRCAEEDRSIRDAVTEILEREYLRS